MLFGCPSSPYFARSFPPRGSLGNRLIIFAEENFVSKILCRQGEGTKWLTIFAEEMKLTEFFQARGRLDVRKGEGMQRNIRKDGGRGEFSP